MKYAIRIFVPVLAIWGAVAVVSFQAAAATREVPSEEWAGAAISLLFVAQSPSPSDAKVENQQGSKASPGTDQKQEAAAQAGTNGAGAAPSPEPKVGESQHSKAPLATDTKQDAVVTGGSNGAEGATSPDPKVGDPQRSKADPKHKAAHAGTKGAGGATKAAKPTARYSYKFENFSFEPRFRLQLRYIHDTASGKNELFIARLRLKAKGELFHAVRYYAEYKFDTLGRPGKDPTHGWENAWLEYSLVRNLALRGGQYDVPFSRNALTSDSKLLFIDRSLIKDQLTSFGFADNTVGLLGHGRPFKGRIEYSAGIFNNEKFRKFHAPGVNSSDHLMPAGRFVYHFLDPAPRGGYADYYSSYVGKGKRLSIGANSAYLKKAHDTVNEFNLFGWGTDVFFSDGPVSAEAEYDQLRKKLIGNPDIRMDGWYAQAAYLIRGRLEFAVRHQQLDRNVSVSNDQLHWTSVGSNYYFQKHHVKVQLDYTFRRGPGQTVKTDVLQIQTQLDY